MLPSLEMSMVWSSRMCGAEPSAGTRSTRVVTLGGPLGVSPNNQERMEERIVIISARLDALV